MQNYVEPIQIEMDEQEQERSSSGTPIYRPNPEVVAASKEAATAPQYKPNSKQTCADCTTATLLLPKAKAGEKKSYISVVSYDDKDGSVSAWELSDFGLVHFILFGGLVFLVLRFSSSSPSAGNSKIHHICQNSGGVRHINFWEKEPEKPRCQPCTGSIGVKKAV